MLAQFTEKEEQENKSYLFLATISTGFLKHQRQNKGLVIKGKNKGQKRTIITIQKIIL